MLTRVARVGFLRRIQIPKFHRMRVGAITTRRWGDRGDNLSIGTPTKMSAGWEAERRPENRGAGTERGGVGRRSNRQTTAPQSAQEDPMANFLYLFRGGNMRQMSPQQLQENMDKWRSWIGELAKKDVYKGGEPLNPEGRQLAAGKQTVTDGPFGETKDVVGGYLIVTAANLDAATELARGCPILQNNGSVEVREIGSM
jgi:hypothetical protein